MIGTFMRSKKFLTDTSRQNSGLSSGAPYASMIRAAASRFPSPRPFLEIIAVIRAYRRKQHRGLHQVRLHSEHIERDTPAHRMPEHADARCVKKGQSRRTRRIDRIYHVLDITEAEIQFISRIIVRLRVIAIVRMHDHVAAAREIILLALQSSSVRVDRRINIAVIQNQERKRAASVWRL